MNLWSYIQSSTFNQNKPNSYQKDVFFNPNLPLSDNLNKLNGSTNFELAKKISNMSNSQNLKSLLHSYGLDIKNVTWEDTARNKNSAYGPNISDMTLRADETNMPVIRRPNFADVTVDHSINNFNVTVGNESGNNLERIKFTDYLENIKKYSSNPNISKLFKDGEEVLCSTQACLLPAAESEVNFNVRIFNYQSSSTNPAVLVIIASNQGTSSMILDSKTTDILFNSSGRSFDYVAERLKEERKRLGKDLNAPMSLDEKDRNVLFVFQIPLKQKETLSNEKFGMSYNFSNLYDDFDSQIIYPETATIHEQSYEIKKSSGQSKSSKIFNKNLFNSNNFNDIEDKAVNLLNQSMVYGSEKKTVQKIGLDNAMLRVGDKDKGAFEGTRGLVLERDFRYPIRCTLQYYWITDTEEISQEQISQIASQLETFYTNSSNKSSLVYGKTHRSTEPKTNIIKENPSFNNYLNKFF